MTQYIKLQKFVWYKDRLLWIVKQKVRTIPTIINGHKTQPREAYIILSKHLTEQAAKRSIEKHAQPDALISRGADRKKRP